MILIHAHPAKIHDGLVNAKSYPWWSELIRLLSGQHIIQIGLEDEEQLVNDFRKNLKLKDIENLVKDCYFWISIDSFLPHLAHHLSKPGVVIWGVSDPNIFGYSENLNILKDRKYLRKNQFGIWSEQSYVEDAFLKPQEIYEKISKIYPNL